MILNEFPSQANTILLQAKDDIERSGNLKREIRDNVVSALHMLHEMVLKLADSRALHMMETHRAKTSLARDMERIAKRHAIALESAHNENKVLKDDIKTLMSDLEAVRRIIVFDLCEPIEEVKKTVKRLDNEITNTKSSIQELQGKLEEVNRPRLSNEQEVNKKPINEEAIETGRQRECGTNINEDEKRKQTEGSKRITYSQALKVIGDGHKPKMTLTPRFSLSVESSDPRHSGDDIVNEVKQKVDVVELGIGVNSFKKLKNQKIIIGCETEEDRGKLETAIKKSNNKFTVSQLQNKRPLLKLNGVIQGLTNTQIEDAIVRQNQKLTAKLELNTEEIRVKRRTRGRTQDTNNIIVEATTKLWAALLDQKLHIGYQIITAVDQSPLIQCYHCLRYGHLARECKGNVTCGYCGDSHDTRLCNKRDLEPVCANCKNNDAEPNESRHAAYSSMCPEWRKWDRIARNAVAYC